MRSQEDPMKETEEDAMKETEQAVINEQQQPSPPLPLPGPPPQHNIHHHHHHKYKIPKQETHTTSLPALPPKTITMNNHNNIIINEDDYDDFNRTPQRNIVEEEEEEEEDPPPLPQPQPQPQHDIFLSSISNISSPSPPQLHLQQTNQFHYSVSPPELALTKNLEPPSPPPVHTVHVQDGEEGSGGGGGGGRRLREKMMMLRRGKKEKMKRKGVLVLRCVGCLLCLVSFSVLAADHYKGWALDSFYHYTEFNYLVAVNVMGFVYSGIQACDDLFFTFSSSTHLLRNYLDFSLDQAS